MLNSKEQLPVFRPSRTGGRAGGGRPRGPARPRRAPRSPPPPQCQHGGQHPGSCLLGGSARGPLAPGNGSNRGLRPTRNFRGPSGEEGGRARPGRERGGAGSPPALPGDFPTGQLRHLGATLREGAGGRSLSSPAALKLHLPGGRRRGRRPEGGKEGEGAGGGKGSPVRAGPGRAGPPHKGRSPAAPCGHSPAAAAPCRCRSARRWAGSCG